MSRQYEPSGSYLDYARPSAEFPLYLPSTSVRWSNSSSLLPCSSTSSVLHWPRAPLSPFSDLSPSEQEARRLKATKKRRSRATPSPTRKARSPSRSRNDRDKRCESSRSRSLTPDGSRQRSCTRPEADRSHDEGVPSRDFEISIGPYCLNDDRREALRENLTYNNHFGCQKLRRRSESRENGKKRSPEEPGNTRRVSSPFSSNDDQGDGKTTNGMQSHFFALSRSRSYSDYGGSSPHSGSVSISSESVDFLKLL